MTSTTSPTPTRPAHRSHTGDEIESAILSATSDLARDDDDMVPWSRVRARLPRTFGYWPVQDAMHRLWRRGDLVLMKISGSPHIGIADECSRLADAACARRGEPRRLLVL